MVTHNVVTRFAPSPTGFVHIGGIRTALFAYLFAKKHGGTFILRIEDTDKEREVEGSIEHIMESLTWLSLAWDYGPDKAGPFGETIQSKRLSTYKEYAKMLVDKGLAYPDPYTEDEVAKFRSLAENEKRPFLFRDHRPKSFETWDGKKTLRFKVPEIKRYKWVDAVRGELEAGVEALDDFILLKSDGYPTYNFAHIIDDYLMGVTHILRADEFISSTPRFLSLYDALEIERPVFVTLPPILAPGGKKKLSKRDGAKDILDYKKDGYLPEALINFLALIGWNPGTDEEVFTMSELVDRFSIEQIQAHGGVMNEEKLRWFNREHILRLTDDEFIAHAREYLSEETRADLDRRGLMRPVVSIMRERIHLFSDVTLMEKNGDFSYYAKAPHVSRDFVLNGGKLAQEEVSKYLTELNEILKELNIWETSSVKEAVMPFAELKGKGNVLWPMRAALSGKDKSPDPFTIAGIIGKDETIQRINAALSALHN